MRKHTTSINEKARHVLDISRDEYALCDYVQFRLADPRAKSGGWCSDTKQEIADFVGISRPGLYKMLDKMERLRLLEIDAITGFARVTGRWIDAVSECKQSLQGGVNKVYSECKQSLQAGVNKVTRIKEEKEYSKNKGEKSESERTPAEISEALEAEKNNSGLVAPPAAEPPTHTVTTINPEMPDVRVVSPFTMPTRAATILEAEQKISAWILGDGLETVKYRHETAKRIFDTANANALAAHYVSVYASTNEGSRASLLRDPVAHFEAGLFKYLKNESAFERQNAPRESGQTRPQTRSTTTNFGSDESKFQQPQIF